MRLHAVVPFALIALASASSLQAQDYYPESNDPPGRAARISYIDGTVSFQPGGVEDWVAATLNRPVTTGDRLWTEGGARVELLTGSAAFRLGGRTNVSFLNLTDNLAQIQLSTGILAVRVRNLYPDEAIEIDTPHGAFSLLQPGDYRFNVDEQGIATLANIRSGEVEITADEEMLRVGSGEQVRVSNEYGRFLTNRRSLPAFDSFDLWTQDRDRREDRSVSRRYVSREVPGYADLDDYGAWQQDVQYSWVWLPRVASSWAPYRYGHWTWIEPWGWTWVDDSPWGYAPFHYGRWVFLRGAWGWIPGPILARPIFCPALVAWFGGPGFRLGFSIGGPPVGWFPLGPNEIWLPPFHHSERYRERVNISNTTIVNRTTIDRFDGSNQEYMNRRVPGAVTAVAGDVLVNGRAVARNAVTAPPEAIDRGQVRNFNDAIPAKTAVLDGRSAGVAPPAGIVNRRVFAKSAPSESPVPFEQRQRAIQENPGRPVDRSTLDRLRQTQPPVAQRPQVIPARPREPQPAAVPQRRVAPEPRAEPRVVAPAPQRQRVPFENRSEPPVPQQPRATRPPVQQQPAPAPAPAPTPRQPQVMTPRTAPPQAAPQPQAPPPTAPNVNRGRPAPQSERPADNPAPNRDPRAERRGPGAGEEN